MLVEQQSEWNAQWSFGPYPHPAGRHRCHLKMTSSNTSDLIWLYYSYRSYWLNLIGLSDNGCAGPLVKPLALALNISTKQQAQTVTSPTAQQLLRYCKRLSPPSVLPSTPYQMIQSSTNLLNPSPKPIHPQSSYSPRRRRAQERASMVEQVSHLVTSPFP